MTAPDAVMLLAGLAKPMKTLLLAAALAMLSPALSLAQSNTPEAEQLFAHARNVRCGSPEPVNPWDVAVASAESPQIQALLDTLSDLVKNRTLDSSAKLVREQALIDAQKTAVRQWRCRGL
jgi:hypothetical protein